MISAQRNMMVIEKTLSEDDIFSTFEFDIEPVGVESTDTTATSLPSSQSFSSSTTASSNDSIDTLEDCFMFDFDGKNGDLSEMEKLDFEMELEMEDLCNEELASGDARKNYCNANLYGRNMKIQKDHEKTLDKCNETKRQLELIYEMLTKQREQKETQNDRRKNDEFDKVCADLSHDTNSFLTDTYIKSLVGTPFGMSFNKQGQQQRTNSSNVPFQGMNIKINPNLLKKNKPTKSEKATKIKKAVQKKRKSKHVQAQVKENSFSLDENIKRFRNGLVSNPLFV